MKLILLTPPDFFVEEDKILTALFEEGLDVLHLRKPGCEPVYSERLLTLLPECHHDQIVVHEHFYLKDEFNLRGIHLNNRNPEPPANYKGHISKSFHDIDTMKKEKRNFNYVFLSPIFDSISKSGYKSAFETNVLEDASARGIIDKKVMALGGVADKHIPYLQKIGFGGCALLGYLPWTDDYLSFVQKINSIVNHVK